MFKSILILSNELPSEKRIRLNKYEKYRIKKVI